MYSLETRIKALAVAGLMAASVAGSTVTAFAEGTDPTNTIVVEKDEEGAPVKKDVQVADGITLPEKSMEFAATYSMSSVAEMNETKAPSINKLTLTFTEGATGATLVQNGEIALKKEFKSAVPGEYVYTLIETTKTVVDENGYGWTCNPDNVSYVLRVYVDSSKNVKYTILKSKDDNGQLDNADANDKKLDKASFSNIYTKRGGSNIVNDPSLKVDKKVVGTYGDTDKYFKFTVKFDVPDTDQYRNDGKNTFTMTFSDNENGKYVNEEKDTDGYDSTTSGITLTDDGSYVFYLKNGGSVSFDDLPAGTYYTLAETGYDGYTAKLTAEQNGKDEITVQGNKNEGVSKDRLLIGENKNTVAVENTYKDITITGVVTHSAPFVIMVGALFVAVGGYVVLKKRIEE